MTVHPGALLGNVSNQGSVMNPVCSGYLQWQGMQRENNSSNKGTARNREAISTAVGEGSTINCSKGCESKGNIAVSGAGIVCSFKVNPFNCTNC